MKTQKKIEQYLRAAPKPPAPDGLLDRLRQDVPARDAKIQRLALRRWFAPAGRPISLWRVAAVTAIAILVLLPLSYGAAKVIKHFITFQATFEYPEDGGVYGVGAAIGGADLGENEAMEMAEEIRKLCAEGKAEEVEPGVWMVTLSDGRRIGLGGADPEFMALTDVEKNKLLKKQFDEINELRKAGKFEKIYKPEHDFEIDGVKHRFYLARYTLSDGTVKIVGSSEPVKDEDSKN